MASRRPKFIDAFAAAFDAYAREGLEQARAAKAKTYRVDWGDMPFFTRAFNLARYWDGRSEPYDDALDLPPFPYGPLKKLRKKLGPSAQELFQNGEGVQLMSPDGWDTAFDGPEDIEAGRWVCLMVDATILRLESVHRRTRGIAVEFRGHDGQDARKAAYYIDNIRDLREERGYSVPAAAVKELLEIFTDRPDPAWLKAAATLPTGR